MSVLCLSPACFALRETEDSGVLSKTTQLVSAHALERDCWVGCVHGLPTHMSLTQLFLSSASGAFKAQSGSGKGCVPCRGREAVITPRLGGKGCHLALCHLPSVVRWKPSRVILAPLRPQGRMGPLPWAELPDVVQSPWSVGSPLWGPACCCFRLAGAHNGASPRGIPRHWPHCCCLHLPPASAT